MSQVARVSHGSLSLDVRPTPVRIRWMDAQDVQLTPSSSLPPADGDSCSTSQQLELSSQGEVWWHTLQLVVWPIVINLAFISLPLTTSSEGQNVYYFVFLFYFVYSFLSAIFGIQLFGLFLPSAPLPATVAMSFGFSCVCAIYQLLVLHWRCNFVVALPFSLLPGSLVILPILFAHARTYQRRYLLITKPSTRLQSPRVSDASIFVGSGIPQLALDTYDKPALLRRYRNLSRKLRAEWAQIRGSPIDMYIKVLLLLCLILSIHLFCQLFTALYSHYALSPLAKVVVASLFPTLLLPLRWLLLAVADSIDRIHSSIQETIHTVASRVVPVSPRTDSKLNQQESTVTVQIKPRSLHVITVTVELPGIPATDRLYTQIANEPLCYSKQNRCADIDGYKFNPSGHAKVLSIPPSEEALPTESTFPESANESNVSNMSSASSSSFASSRTSVSESASISIPKSIHGFQPPVVTSSKSKCARSVHELRMRPLMLWTATLFRMMFYRMLFISIRDAATFAALQAVEQSIRIIVFSAMISSKMHSIRRRIASRLNRSTESSLISRLLFFCIRVDEDVTVQRQNYCVEFFNEATAQRTSVIAFILTAVTLRNNCNVRFFPFSDEDYTDSQFREVMLLSLVMLFSEWTVAVVAYFYAKFRFGLDIMQLGASPFVQNSKLKWMMILTCVHIHQDALIATNVQTFINTLF